MPTAVRRYMNLGVFNSRTGQEIYRNIKYPEIPIGDRDFYLYASEFDRYDLLANRFYNNQSMWWIISIANSNNELNSLFPPVGKRIRIPADPQAILTEFSEINNIPISFDYNTNINTKTLGQSKITFNSRLSPEEREFKTLDRRPVPTNMRLSDIQTTSNTTTPSQQYTYNQTQNNITTNNNRRMNGGGSVSTTSYSGY